MATVSFKGLKPTYSTVCSRHLSLPRLFTPDLKLITCFTYLFIHSLSGSIWTVITYLALGRSKWAMACVCCSFFFIFCFWLRVLG